MVPLCEQDRVVQNGRVQPDSLAHPAFGRAIWSPKHGCFSGRFEIAEGMSVELGIRPFDSYVPGHEPTHLDDERVFAEVVADRITQLRSRMDDVKAFATHTLIGYYNEGDWCEGKPIGPDEFASRLTVQGIDINEDLEINVFLDDGDLFWGHTVLIACDERGRPIRAEFFG